MLGNHVDIRARREHNLPDPPTSIVGRERDLESIRHVLAGDDARLLTLTGPGGVGKTRLAVEVATRAVDRFQDGAWLVELAPIHDAGLVLSAIATTLSVQESSQQSLLDDLIGVLRERQALLVLDNIEQVRDAGPQIAELIRWCPHLRILATGRTSLDVRAERQYPVQPLGVTEPETPIAAGATSPSPAVALFTERARAANPHFTLTDDNAPVIAEICRRVDGLPLAIELAATQIQVLEPAALLSRLERHLPFINRCPRDLPARQRTIERTIAWSHDLLEPAEQVLLRSLAVCAGGFSLETAVEIRPCPAGDGSELDVLNSVSALVTHNLLRRVTDVNGAPRFTMLEMTRAYALDRLSASGEAEALRRRHALHFLAFAQHAEVALRAPNRCSG